MIRITGLRQPDYVSRYYSTDNTDENKLASILQLIREKEWNPHQNDIDPELASDDDLAEVEKLQKEAEDFRTKNSLLSLVANDNKNGLVQYFIPDIVEIAKKNYTKSNNFTLQDIVHEGVISASHVINTRKFNSIKIRGFVLDGVRQGIRNFLLREEVNRLIAAYDTEALDKTGVDTTDELRDILDKETVENELARVLQSLPDRRMPLILKARYSFHPLTFKKIAQGEIGGGAARMQQLEKKAISKIRNTWRAEKLGALVRDIYGVEPTGKQVNETELIRDLERLKRDLGSYPDEIMRRFGLNQKEFAKFLARVYPRLEGGTAIQLTTLSQEERKRINHQWDPTFVERCVNVRALKRTIRHLEKKKHVLESHEKVDLQDRVKELYFPLFISDSKKCISKLNQESIELSDSPELASLFQNAAAYFTNVLDLQIPELKAKLDNFQKVDVEILCRRNGYINANDMGTGKSIEAIAYALKKGLKKILIITTKSGACSVWPKELKKHLLEDPDIVFLNSESLKDDSIFDVNDRTWYVSTYSAATRNIGKLRRAGFDLVILDECHKVNNSHTGQSAAILSLDPQSKLAISGSLFKNRRKELFPVLNWIWPDNFPNAEDFEERFCMFGKGRGLNALQYELRSRVVCRLKDEVLKLPPLKSHIVSVSSNDIFRHEYTEMEADFISWFEKQGGDINDTFLSQAVFTKLHTLRTKAIEPKLLTIDKLVKEGIKRGEKTVLYTTYVLQAEDFKKRYEEYGVCYLEGRSTNYEREKAIREFEKDPNKKIFVVTSAGGESIDLTPAQRLIFVNKPLTYADEKQMVDRLHRRGQKDEVSVYHVTTEDTIEERIEKLIKRKKEEYKRVVIDGRAYTIKFFEETESSNIKELIEGMVIKEKKLSA